VLDEDEVLQESAREFGVRHGTYGLNLSCGKDDEIQLGPSRTQLPLVALYIHSRMAAVFSEPGVSLSIATPVGANRCVVC
jgi:hypothetical protein